MKRAWRSKMDLPNPTERKLIHNRKVRCKGYARADGDFDIEAELIDSKTYDFPSDFHGTVAKDTPYHHMKLRITVDIDMIVKDALATTLLGPYPICPQGAYNFKKLIGIKIGPGWKRRVHSRIGGSSGCTHITELTGPMATTAYQTVGGEISRQKRLGKTLKNLIKDDQTNALENSCIAYSKTSI